MGFISGVGTVGRRDAAVAAALSGAVVVILGYASGLGIRMPSVIAVAPPPAQAAPAAPEATSTEPMPMGGGPASEPVTAMAVGVDHGGVARDLPGPPTTTPALPVPSKPPTTPGPKPTDQRICPPGVLTSQPVAASLTEPVASLLSTLIASMPVLNPLAAPPSPGRAPGPLTCVVGTVVGPSCCGSAAASAKTRTGAVR